LPLLDLCSADARLIIDTILLSTLSQRPVLATVRTEQLLKQNHLPWHRTDYLFRRGSEYIGLLEAKRGNLRSGFAQLCCQLISLQTIQQAHAARNRSTAVAPLPPLFGLLCDGYYFAFVILAGEHFWIHGPEANAATQWSDLFDVVGVLSNCLQGNYPAEILKGGGGAEGGSEGERNGSAAAAAAAASGGKVQFYAVPLGDMEEGDDPIVTAPAVEDAVLGSTAPGRRRSASAVLGIKGDTKISLTLTRLLPVPSIKAATDSPCRVSKGEGDGWWWIILLFQPQSFLLSHSAKG